ncbi:MAG TPA: hypothetical protein VM582_02210, partial [Candidatus Thermoplasmatota archaeon]|nr:hypothetical protein [Candidatus Thermoplasmatota archaeon]
MRTYALLAVALLLAPPGAAAWEARFVAAPSEVSLAASLLLAGAVHASAPSGGFFGAPHAQRLLFDAPVAVRFCPDQAGEPQSSPQCPGGSGTTGARLYVRSGGLVAFAPDGELNLSTRASAAALGGPNVTLNKRAVGAGVYVGGNAVVTSTGGALVVRPLLPNASIEVRGDDGFFTYNGTAYTLVVSGGFNESRLEARGAFLAAPDIDVRVERAGLREAEAHLRVEELFTTLRALQPAERADRRAAVAGAFGLFQLVPALLDGAAATRANLTLNDEARSEFTFVRLSDARFGHDGANWTGSGNATYMTDAAVLAPHPDAHVRFPVLVPLVIIGGAIVAR